MLTEKKMNSGMLSLHVVDKMHLYKSYMPFLKNGGLYVPTTQKYSMHAEIFLLVKLPDDDTKYPIIGKIVWINNTSNVVRQIGVGIHFSDKPESFVLKEKIEKLILGISQDTPTYTM